MDRVNVTKEDTSEPLREPQKGINKEEKEAFQQMEKTTFHISVLTKCQSC